MWLHLGGSDQPEPKAHLMEYHPHNPPLAYSIKQASEVSSLGKTTLYRHASRGNLRLVRVGGRTIIPADSLHALLEGGK